MKLLCDQMLGSLAKWLRILGFDTFYADSETTDDELLQIAKNENRILISRDKEIIFRGKRRNLDVIEIITTDLDEQLEQVLKKITIDDKAILSRCTVCNEKIETIEKSKVRDKVPKKVFENNDTFWFCTKCSKFYWMGSHYENILNKLQKFTKK